MSEHLCLKWNNHSLAFLKGIKNIEAKEKYCDATIVCQGKYFPVHRFILSTCSEYFEEIFDRIKCPHPYIVFKDIEPREIEFLLSFMYQGEVNVLQEILPTFIKAAEALKIKGLAVPDEFTNKEERNKKRPNTSTDGSHPKRRAEESVRRKNSSNSHESSLGSSNRSSREYSSNSVSDESQIKEQIVIKEEPTTQDFESPAADTEFFSTFTADGSVIDNYPINEDNAYIKSEPGDNSVLPVDDQSWSEIDNDFNTGQNFSSAEGTLQNEDIFILPEGAPDDHEQKYESEPKYEDFSVDQEDLVSPTPEDNPSPTPEDNNWATDDDELEPRRPKVKQSAKSFRCPYCDYVNGCSTDVRKHVTENHTGDYPHACRLCVARFAEKLSLNIHMMTHSKELKGFLSTPRMHKRDSHSK